MSTAENLKRSEEDNIILGKERTNLQRNIAFLSILVIYFFYCYNFMVGTFVKPTMIYTIAEGGFGFTLKQTESIFAIMSFATIPGTLLFGWMSSKLGKKYTLMIVALTITATTYLPMLSPMNYTLWRIARFTTGFALGGVFGTAVPLVAEMYKQKYRGKLAAIMTSTFSVAMIFGGKLYGLLGDANWDILMYTAIIPPAIGAILVYFFVPNDYEYTRQLISSAKEKGEKINYLSMYKGKYLWIGIGVILLSGANFTAYSSFSNNSTTYLKTVLGMSAAAAGSIYSMQGWGQLIGYNVWGTIADRFGRKVPAIGMGLSAVAVFIYMQLSSSDVSMFKVISLLLGFCVGFSGAWGAYYTELFPKRFSALAPGISFNGGRLISTYALPMIAGVAATSAGMPGIFRISMIVFVIGAVVWFLLPETLNKARED
ncbi:MFS transporter [Acidaminobacter hydrogenoformans]|uniref:Predicted arabinose efflux permease, MFS family n=1 Tax=Acidaminobacter hydrogenoformans DSM 2784 TaxID=1120920 RepID=A0A1G5RXJ6_9FIRM|nr:MFS transporter [Acidaminobacter hydrogenoformans]SCZ78578.1 Predicted arabinose efflux permease, MFS family [Acidaminobacter hydrogenoformans DSM 2784]